MMRRHVVTADVDVKASMSASARDSLLRKPLPTGRERGDDVAGTSRKPGPIIRDPGRVPGGRWRVQEQDHVEAQAKPISMEEPVG